jgi:hypothetical protein
LLSSIGKCTMDAQGVEVRRMLDREGSGHPPISAQYRLDFLTSFPRAILGMPPICMSCCCIEPAKAALHVEHLHPEGADKGKLAK